MALCALLRLGCGDARMHARVCMRHVRALAGPGFGLSAVRRGTR